MGTRSATTRTAPISSRIFGWLLTKYASEPNQPPLVVAPRNACPNVGTARTVRPACGIIVKARRFISLLAAHPAANLAHRRTIFAKGRHRDPQDPAWLFRQVSEPVDRVAIPCHC